jgi:hypothetical protein
MRCPMCANEFTRDHAALACRGCPFARGCKRVRCPRCGYEMPGETRLGQLVRRLRGARATKAGN